LAEQFSSPAHYAPLADLRTWQTAINPAGISPKYVTVDPGNPGERVPPKWTLPELGQQLEGDAWVNDPAAPAWRLRAARSDGFVDFHSPTPVGLGKVGFAVTQIYSSRARQANFAVEADYWFILKVNGQTYMDQSVTGRVYALTTKGAVQVQVPLRAGWNQVEMKVGSGSVG
jgi:hypothetical protein